MKRWSGFVLLAIGVAGLSGCAMCASPFDCEYPAYGGRVDRADRNHGRVGSIFSQAGVPPMALTEQGATGYDEGAVVETPADLDWSFANNDEASTFTELEPASDLLLFPGDNDAELVAPTSGIELLPFDNEG